MGTHAERVAISEHVSREDQDAFALASHQKAIAAIDAGRFDAEMAPVTVRDAKGRETVVTTDEGPRRDSTAEALAKLKPAFALPDGEDRGDAIDGHGHGRQRPGHHRRRRRHGRRLGARRRAPRPEAARPDRRLRPGRGRPQVAVPRARRGRPPAARPDRAADRGLRPHRDQRGVRRPDPRRRAGARLRLGQGQRQRRRDRARPPDRGERRADRRDAAPRAGPPRGPLRPRDPVPGRRRLGRHGRRARVTSPATQIERVTLRQGAFARGAAARPTRQPATELWRAANWRRFRPWPDVIERLRMSSGYWIATVTPDGRPHVVPIWGVFVGNDLFLETGAPGTVKNRNLAVASARSRSTWTASMMSCSSVAMRRRQRRISS